MAQLNDPARLSALRDAQLLDTDPEPAFDRITALASRLVGAPVALVSLVDDKRQFFKSQHGLPEPRETPLSHSFCQHVVASESMLSVGDARTDALVKDNGAVKDLGVVAYLGVPLKNADGVVLGSLCVIDGKPRQWSADDAAALIDLSQIVMDEIALRNEVRQRREIEAKNDFLIAELHHRVKNTLATVQAVVQMSLRAATDLQTFGVGINSRIASLANTHTMLSAQQWAAISFRDLLTSELAPYDRAGRVTLQGPDFTMASQTAVTIGMVFHELATNASKYGALRSPDGSLSVEWTLRRDGAENIVGVRWIESGGPSVVPPSRQGFGSNLLRRLVERQLNGSVDMRFDPAGLRVTIEARMPAATGAPPPLNVAVQKP